MEKEDTLDIPPATKLADLLRQRRKEEKKKEWNDTKQNLIESSLYESELEDDFDNSLIESIKSENDECLERSTFFTPTTLDIYPYDSLKVFKTTCTDNCISNMWLVVPFLISPDGDIGVLRSKLKFIVIGIAHYNTDLQSSCVISSIFGRNMKIEEKSICIPILLSDILKDISFKNTEISLVFTPQFSNVDWKNVILRYNYRNIASPSFMNFRDVHLSYRVYSGVNFFQARSNDIIIMVVNDLEQFMINIICVYVRTQGTRYRYLPDDLIPLKNKKKSVMAFLVPTIDRPISDQKTLIKWLKNPHKKIDLNNRTIITIEIVCKDKFPLIVVTL